MQALNSDKAGWKGGEDRMVMQVQVTCEIDYKNLVNQQLPCVINPFSVVFVSYICITSLLLPLLPPLISTSDPSTMTVNHKQRQFFTQGSRHGKERNPVFHGVNNPMDVPRRKLVKSSSPLRGTEISNQQTRHVIKEDLLIPRNEGYKEHDGETDPINQIY